MLDVGYPLWYTMRMKTMLHYLILDSENNIIATMPDGNAQVALEYAFNRKAKVQTVSNWGTYAPCQVYGYRAILNGKQFTPNYEVIK